MSTTLYAVTYTRTEHAVTPYCALFTQEAQALDYGKTLFEEFEGLRRVFLHTFVLDGAGRVSTIDGRVVPRPEPKKYEVEVRTYVKVLALDADEARNKARALVRANGPHWTEVENVSLDEPDTPPTQLPK